MAEGSARLVFEKAGIKAHLDSAGTGDWHVGRAPDPRAQAEVKRRGSDISDLRARQLQVSDFYDFDLILAADAQNLTDAMAIAPADGTAQVMRMLDLVEDWPRTSVTDPYYGENEGFAETWDDVLAVAEALAARYA